MSLPAQTRSTYRKLLRAASSTFAGDAPNQIAFRYAIRRTFVSPNLESYFAPSAPSASARSKRSACSPSSSSASASSCSTSPPPPSEPSTLSPSNLDEAAYRARLDHWSDVAKILTRNVVQGRQKSTPREESGRRIVSEEEEGPWALRITPLTELGDNSSIKTVPKQSTEPFPNRRKRRERERVVADGA